jgi:UDP-glucose 4-epimerase
MKSQKSNQVRVLLVGGGGFIGSNLTCFLLARGAIPTIYDYKAPHANVPFIDASMASCEQLLLEQLGVTDVVVHMAWTTIPSSANLDPTADLISNVGFSLRLMDMCIAAPSPPAILFLSSGGAVYGPQGIVPTAEAASPNPISAYGLSKLTVERYIILNNKLRGLRYLILRPSNPYGPLANINRSHGFIPTALNRILMGEPIILWGDGNIVRDYVYVEDLTDAIYRGISALHRKSKTNTIMNIGTGVGHSLNEILELLTVVTGKVPEVRFLDPRPEDVPVAVLDSKIALEALGWSPKVSLLNGIEKTWRWLKEKNA